MKMSLMGNYDIEKLLEDCRNGAELTGSTQKEVQKKGSREMPRKSEIILLRTYINAMQVSVLSTTQKILKHSIHITQSLILNHQCSA